MKTILVGATIILSAMFAPAAEKPALVPVSGGGIVVENARTDKVFTLSAAELAKLKHAELKGGSPQVSFTGVPLAEILQAAGVDWSGNCSPLLTCYVVVEAADGYRVVFSIPEIAPAVVPPGDPAGGPLRWRTALGPGRPLQNHRGGCQTKRPLGPPGHQDSSPNIASKGC